jgi:hypothetical protein
VCVCLILFKVSSALFLGGGAVDGRLFIAEKM